MTRFAILFTILLCFSFLSFGQSENSEEIQSMSSRKLLDCARKSDCKFNTYQMSDELAKRQNVDFMVKHYEQGTEYQREVIILAISKIKHDAKAATFMRRVAFSNYKQNDLDTEPRWYALQYLAEMCDEQALRRLNGNQNFRDSYPVACYNWTGTIRTFGRCKYRPAIPHLIESTNTVACLNISDAAIESLMDLFPGKCTKTKTYDEAHDCFLKLSKREGAKQH